MYRTIKRIYENTKKAGDEEKALSYVKEAVAREWINEKQASEIVGYDIY